MRTEKELQTRIKKVEDMALEQYLTGDAYYGGQFKSLIRQEINLLKWVLGGKEDNNLEETFKRLKERKPEPQPQKEDEIAKLKVIKKSISKMRD